MKTLVIGGTGFLGSFIVDALLAEGHTVSVLSRSPARAAATLPAGVEAVAGDVNTLSPRALTTLLRDFDKLVYAAGVDERVRPDTDAREFYCRENVETVKRVLRAAGRVDITHAVLLNSIFTTLNRQHPELELTRHHPYIDSRVQQSEMALDVAKGKFVMSVLEIPWVFGDSGERESQWGPLVHYVRTAPTLLSPNGGAVAVSAETIGRATAGALVNPTHSSSLPIGDATLSWDEMLQQMVLLTGRDELPITRLPDELFGGMFRLGGAGQKLVGLRSGLDFARLQDILLARPEIDLTAAQQLYGYRAGDIRQALADTVNAVPEPAPLAAWRRVLDSGRSRVGNWREAA